MTEPVFYLLGDGKPAKGVYTLSDIIAPTEFELDILLSGGDFYPVLADGEAYRCFYSHKCEMDMFEAKRQANGGCVIHKGRLPKSIIACGFCAKKQEDNPHWLCYYNNEKLCSRQFKSAVQPTCTCFDPEPVPQPTRDVSDGMLTYSLFTCEITDPLIFQPIDSTGQKYAEALDRANGGCIIHQGKWVVSFEYVCEYCREKQRTNRYWLCYYKDNSKCSKEPEEAKQLNCSCNKNTI